jgi:hypothetical protein
VLRELIRYLKACRLFAIAGLAALAVAAIPAASAGAKTKRACTTLLVPPYQECHRVPVISLRVGIAILNPAKKPTVKAKIRVSDPRLIVRLYKAKNPNAKYRLVRTVFNRKVKAGTHRLTIHGLKTGVFYELKVTAKVAATAKVSAGSKTVARFFHPV